MKFRALAVTALAGTLAFSLSGAEAGGPPVMDGKKVTVLTQTVAGGLQQHMNDISFDATVCPATRCAILPFIYRPAKGIKGDKATLLFTATWGTPLSDLDLSIVEVAKNGDGTVVAKCGGGNGSMERAYLDATQLHVGTQYRMVVDFWRSVNETVTEKVEMGVANPIKTTVPAAVDGKQPVNCTQ